MSNEFNYFTALPFWNDLTVTEKAMCADNIKIKTYKAGSSLHVSKGESIGFVKILSGVVRVVMISDEGKEVLLYKLDQHGTDVLSALSVLNNARFDTQIVADTYCEVMIIPLDCLSELIKHNIHVRCALYERLSEHFFDVMMSFSQSFFISLDSKVANFLIDRQKSNQSYVVKTTHEQLAKEINSSRERASRALKKMEKQGALKLRNGKIEIKDLSKLNEYITNGKKQKG